MDSIQSKTIRRILMTTNTVGGVWNYSLQLAEQLREFGIEVVLATLGPRLRPDQRAEVNKLFNVALLESNYKLEWMRDPWNDLEHARKWLLDLERTFKPDIVHLNQYSFASLKWNSPVIVVAHSCVASWWKAVRHGQPLNPRFAKYFEMVRSALEAADYVITPSYAMLNDLEECYKPQFRAKAVIPHGRRINGNPEVEKEPFIFCAGRSCDEAKNITGLLRIARQLSWPVYVAGDVKDVNIRRTGNLHFLGLLSSREMEHWLQRASIFVSPARYEPFALAVLEAAVSRCSLVLGNIPSLRENWNRAALFVDPAVPEQISEAIEQLIADPELMHDYAEKAYDRSMLLTPEKMVFRYLKIYGTLPQNVPESRVLRSQPSVQRTA